VLCRHRERDTYECPGGRREPGEEIELFDILPDRWTYPMMIQPKLIEKVIALGLVR
jgi:hypothetical protein